MGTGAKIFWTATLLTIFVGIPAMWLFNEVVYK